MSTHRPQGENGLCNTHQCHHPTSANVLQSTSAFTEPRELGSMPAFVNSRAWPSISWAISLVLTKSASIPAELPNLPKRLKKAGTPSLIVLSPSGIRAADVVRALKAVRVPEGEDGAQTGKPPGEVGKVSRRVGLSPNLRLWLT